MGWGGPTHAPGRPGSPATPTPQVPRTPPTASATAKRTCRLLACPWTPRLQPACGGRIAGSSCGALHLGRPRLRPWTRRHIPMAGGGTKPCLEAGAARPHLKAQASRLKPLIPPHARRYTRGRFRSPAPAALFGGCLWYSSPARCFRCCHLGHPCLESSSGAVQRRTRARSASCSESRTGAPSGDLQACWSRRWSGAERSTRFHRKHLRRRREGR
mmetsp:Transcript_23548/g.76113  ORF Transcript_23548/g.76113 Transcript_23548/m.76113 type:complete len:215 (-) Transcript_23548:42-686(-)